MDDQIPDLQAKIVDEEKSCNEKIKDIEEDWKNKRPHRANIAPKEAVDILNIIGTKI